MVRILVALAALTISVTACLPDTTLRQGPGLVGTYAVNGVDPGGTEYSGRLIIDRGATAEDLILEWIITGAIHRGEGRVEDDRLIAVWEAITSPRGDATGTAEYEILADGRLVGTRTVDGSTETGTETIYPEP